MATPKDASGDTSPVTEIDECGDVILKLANEKISSKLRVSSHVMGLASPVFKAMFKKGFAKGENLSSSSPKTIPLPDDDPVQMMTMCNIAHMCKSAIPTKLTADELAEFAILCDKYGCRDSVYPWITIWITKLLTDTSMSEAEAGSLLFATFFLELPQEFNEVTKSLVKNCEAPFRAATKTLRDLPLEVIDKINCQREKYLNMALETLFPTFLKNAIRLDWCRVTFQNENAFLRGLEDAGLLPARTSSVNEVRAKFSKMVNAHFLDCIDERCSCSSIKRWAKYDGLAAIDSNIQSIEGCCLDCIQREFGINKDLQCRITHSKVAE